MRRHFFVAFLLAFILTLFRATSVADAAPPAPVTDLRAAKSGTSVILTWTHSDATADHYEVWWSDSPYAAIGDAGMVMIATVTPTATPSQLTYTDTASGVGNPAVNSFYAVRGVTAGGEAFALSNRAGEFDFGVSVDGGQPALLPIVDHCGTISVDEVWGPNAVHRLTCSVTVAAGARLTILAGTQVQASSYVALNVYGNLVAKGSADHPITFTNLTGDASGAQWQGISIGGSATLDHIVVEYTSGSWGPVQIYSSDVRLTNSLIRNNRDGVYLSAAATLEGNTITNNTGTSNGGVWIPPYVTGANLINNVISNNGGGGVKTSGAITLTGNTITNNGGYAVSMDAAAVRDSLLSGNVIRGNLHDAIGISGAYYYYGWGGSVLNGDHVWPDWLTDFQVDIFNHLVVGSTGSLTLPAGLTLRFEGGTSGYYGYSSFLIASGGQLIAQGSATSPIIFTVNDHSTPVGTWTGFRSEQGSTVLLDHVIIEYAYSNQINSDATTITYSTIRHTNGAGLTINANATVTHNTITDNGGGIELSASGVVVTNNTIANNGGTGVTAGVAVTLINNTISNNRGVGVGGYGSAILTGNTISNNGQGGVDLKGGGTFTGNTITGNGGGGVYLQGGATLTNNTITNNAGYAVQIALDAVKDCQLAGNVFTGNGHDAVGIEGGSLSGDHVWGNWLADYDIHILSTVYVGYAGITSGSLTLSPGTTLRFLADPYPSYASLVLWQLGSLTAQGTANAPIVFTANSASPATNRWGGILVSANAAATLDYVIIEYVSAYSGWIIAKSALRIESSDVTVRHSTIRHNGTGIEIYDAAPTVSDNVIRDNYDAGMPGWGIVVRGTGNPILTGNTISGNGGGVYLQGGATLTSNTIANNAGYGIYVTDSSASIHHNNIYGNQGYGLYNAASSDVDARYNWWGSNSGPAPYGSGNGINYDTCWDPERYVYYICDYHVDVDPWLGKAVSTGAQLGKAGPLSSIQAIIADPVNTANGNYAHQHTDIAIPTRGLSLDFTRAYNSLSPQAGPLGYGWTHNWNLALTEDATDGSVTIAFGDGHTEHWTRVGAAYDGGPGVFGLLTRNGDGSFDLLQKDQTKYHFDAAGRLAWAEDRNANRTTLTYDGGGRLLTITEPVGRALTLEYASPVSPTLISRITDPASRAVRFAYDAAGNLVSVTDVTGQVTTMTYNADHRLLTMTDANGHTFLRNVYDARGRVSEQYDALDNKWTFAYDEPAHKTLVTDPRGHVTTYQYDADWRLTSETDALGYTLSYVYDADNNRIQVTDKRGATTRYAYDARGNTTLIADALNGTRSFTYDTAAGRNNLLSETDPRGHTTSYAYDGHSNLTRRTDPLGGVTTWAYNGYGQVTSTTDANGHTTTYGYDPAGYGYRTATTDALGHSTTATFDAAGRKLTETDPLGRTTTYTYDAANRVLTISEPLVKTTAYTYDAVGNRLTVTENGVRTTHYAYDAKNRLVSVTDPLGHTTTYAYDSVDNQISVTDPLGHTTAHAYDALNRRTATADALGNTTAYEYDPNGNRTKVTDANGRVIRYTYDALNRLTGVTDAAGGAVSYGYDAAGNRISMTDANGHTTTYAYDARNRLVSAADPLGHVTGYGYDAVGNRTRETRPDGTVITYAYDAADRLTGISHPAGSVSYAYDAAGNRTTMTDATGVTTYTYDALDRIIEIAGPNGTVGYAYDLFGNRTGITYPGGLTVGYAYDLANRLTTVTDHASRVTTYTYDNANRLTTVAYPNGVQATYTYDDADRLLSITHAHPTHGIITSASYTLDAVGNRLTMTDPDGVTSYTYDALYRLTQVTYPNGETVTYSYDPMGNRLSLVSTVHGTTTYVYDAADRLLSYTGPGGTVNLTWDANGRMTGKGSAVYTYDPLDRLMQVVDGTTTVQFAYDGDGVRLRKTVNGTATDYLQDEAAPLPVVLSETTGGATTRYVYGLDLLELTDPAGKPAYYHADDLGSTRALSNGSGQRTDAYSYDAFGAVRSHSGSATQPFMFAGEETDVETNAVFLRARYMDTLVGRFTTQDAYPADVTRPDSIHRYIYVGQNPVNRVDPTGKCWLLGPLSIPCELVNNPDYGASTSRADADEAMWALIGQVIGDPLMLPVDFVRSMSSSPDDVFQIAKTSRFLKAWMTELKLTLRDANPVNVLRLFDTPLWRDFVRESEKANPWLKHLRVQGQGGNVLGASAEWVTPPNKRR